MEPFGQLRRSLYRQLHHEHVFVIWSRRIRWVWDFIGNNVKLRPRTSARRMPSSRLTSTRPSFIRVPMRSRRALVGGVIVDEAYGSYRGSQKDPWDIHEECRGTLSWGRYQSLLLTNRLRRRFLLRHPALSYTTIRSGRQMAGELGLRTTHGGSQTATMCRVQYRSGRYIFTSFRPGAWDSIGLPTSELGVTTTVASDTFKADIYVAIDANAAPTMTLQMWGSGTGFRILTKNAWNHLVRPIPGWTSMVFRFRNQGEAGTLWYVDNARFAARAVVFR